MPIPLAAIMTDIITLDNPINGSRPAIRTDYTGHKTKGNPLFSVIHTNKTYKIYT